MALVFGDGTVLCHAVFVSPLLHFPAWARLALPPCF